MDRINLDETQESLADVIARVESGETVVVTRCGEAVAKIEAIVRKRASEPRKLKPIDVERLRKLTENMTYQEESAGEFMRRLRDDARY